MKGWPKTLLNSGATARASRSVVPPGANGTTIFTGLVGQAACAKAEVAIEIIAVPTRAVAKR